MLFFIIAYQISAIYVLITQSKVVSLEKEKLMRDMIVVRGNYLENNNTLQNTYTIFPPVPQKIMCQLLLIFTRFLSDDKIVRE